MKKFAPLWVVAAGLVLVLLSSLALGEKEAPERTVYFFVHSGACPCQLEMCHQAEPIASQIEDKLTVGVKYERLDYGETPERIEPLVQKYKLFAFPVILVVDSKDKELFRTQGKINRVEILKKLEELGIITGGE